MSITAVQMCEALSQCPFADDWELAAILDEPLGDIHDALNDLLNTGIVGRASHSTAYLPRSWRYYLTGSGIGQVHRALGCKTRSAYLRDCPMSREWHRILIRRLDAVASVYRIAATMSLGAGGLKSGVTFCRKGHIDAMITLSNGGRFAIVRQGRALRRARLNDHLRAIHEYEYPRRPDVVLVLTPSAWERDLTTQYWMARAFQGGYVAVESADALTRHDLPVWSRVKSVIGGVCSLAEVLAETSLGDQQPAVSPARKRASMPDTEDMVRAAAAFGLSRDEKSMFEIVTDHPMIPRTHLIRWLGVSPARLSQITRSLTANWGLVVRREKRPNLRYTLSAEGIRYVAYRDRTTQATTRGLWSTQPAAAPTKASPYEGSLINEWATHTEHADGITKLLSEFAAEARDATDSALLWSVPEWRSERKYHWNSRSIKPDAVGVVITKGVRVPFYLEYEKRAKYPAGIRLKLRPYEYYYWAPDTAGDMPPYPVTLFVVDSETTEDNYVRTAAGIELTLPILVSCMPKLEGSGILERSWRPLWEPDSPRIRLSNLADYAWDRFYKRMVRER